MVFLHSIHLLNPLNEEKFKFKEFPTTVIVRDGELEIDYDLHSYPSFFIIEGFYGGKNILFSLVGNSSWEAKIISLTTAGLNLTATTQIDRKKTIIRASQISASDTFTVKMAVLRLLDLK